jgi:hypothetical protein
MNQYFDRKPSGAQDFAETHLCFQDFTGTEGGGGTPAHLVVKAERASPRKRIMDGV